MDHIQKSNSLLESQMDRDDLGPKYFSEVCVFLELSFHYKQRVPLRLIADEPFGPLALPSCLPFPAHFHESCFPVSTKIFAAIPTVSVAHISSYIPYYIVRTFSRGTALMCVSSAQNSPEYMVEERPGVGTANYF